MSTYDESACRTAATVGLQHVDAPAGRPHPVLSNDREKNEKDQFETSEHHTHNL